MEAVIEKISLVSDKIDIIELYSVGEKIHDVLNQCNQNCRCLQYLSDLKSLIDSINTNELHANQKISKKNFFIFFKENLFFFRYGVDFWK